mmetsp:Transcript_60694/g.130340  ORF Transcript_60694/g.130340 Transcript_60694/m.130340 type:complete len:360 (+) Transcript_60694:76-1155(+)
MIGLVLRAISPASSAVGGGLVAGVLGSIVAICAICGIWKCSKCRMRHCNCIKWCMRSTGADKFDDFELMVLVHEVMFTSKVAKRSIRVRITASSQSVMTDPSTNNIFQQPVAVFVEQGTEFILVELIEATGKKVLANLKLDVEKDIMGDKKQIEQVLGMKQKSKDMLNPRIKLTLHSGSDMDAEKGLLSNLSQNMSTETDLMLRQQIHKVNHQNHQEEQGQGSSGESQRELSELELVAKACSGPLEKFGSWGSRESVYVSVRGPPDQKRYVLGIFKDQNSYEKGQPPKSEIDLLKVVSVQPDPGRAEVFILTYIDKDKTKQRLTCRRIDRARDVWVEMLQILIKLVRDEKDAAKAAGGK